MSPLEGAPTPEDLREVVAYLDRGRRGTWTLEDWLAWSGKAFGWCWTTTRGFLRALIRIRELEAENAMLRAELVQVRRSSSPATPTVVPPIRRAAHPPPAASPEASALRGRAQRPPTELEAEVLRRVQARLPEIVADEWREVSAVDLEIEDPDWASAGETVFEEPA